MAKIKFTGGPFDGKTLEMFPQKRTAPETMGCYSDAVKVGMYGIYRKTATCAMLWEPAPPPKTAKAAKQNNT